MPESGTEVFAVSTRNASEPAYTSGFPVDFALARYKGIANNWDTGSRLQQGNRMFTNLTNAEASNSNMMFDYQDGWSAGTGASTNIFLGCGNVRRASSMSLLTRGTEQQDVL